MNAGLIFSFLAFATATSHAAFAAEAAQLIPPQRISYRATLTEMNLDPQLSFSAVGGFVEIELTGGKITLALHLSADCPPNAACDPNPTRFIELPLVTTQTDSCGITTYRAAEDKRPMDGIYQELKVHDYSQAVCGGRPLAPTVITYDTRGYSRMEHEYATHSSFGATELYPIVDELP